MFTAHFAFLTIQINKARAAPGHQISCCDKSQFWFPFGFHFCYLTGTTNAERIWNLVSCSMWRASLFSSPRNMMVQNIFPAVPRCIRQDTIGLDTLISATGKSTQSENCTFPSLWIITFVIPHRTWNPLYTVEDKNKQTALRADVKTTREASQTSKTCSRLADSSD